MPEGILQILSFYGLIETTTPKASVLTTLIWECIPYSPHYTGWYYNSIAGTKTAVTPQDELPVGCVA